MYLYMYLLLCRCVCVYACMYRIIAPYPALVFSSKYTPERIVVQVNQDFEATQGKTCYINHRINTIKILNW